MQLAIDVPGSESLAAADGSRTMGPENLRTFQRTIRIKNNYGEDVNCRLNLTDVLIGSRNLLFKRLEVVGEEVLEPVRCVRVIHS